MIKAFFILIFLQPLISYSQDYYSAQFSEYLDESKNIIKTFVDIKIDSIRIQFEYYTPDHNNPTLLKSVAYGIQKTSLSKNKEDVIILASGMNIIVKRKSEKTSEVKMVYFGRTIEHYKLHNQFFIPKPVITKPKNTNLIYKIQNPQFDFISLEEPTIIDFSFYGISLDLLELRSNNSEVKLGFNSAIVSHPTDSICNLQLYNKKNDSLLYEKSFLVVSGVKSIDVKSTFKDSIWSGGDISTRGFHRLFPNRINILHITNWKEVMETYNFEVTNAKIISFEQGELKIIPSGTDIVEISVIDKKNGLFFSQSQYAVIK